MAAGPANRNIIMPPPLLKGDVVGIAAASGPPDQTCLNKGAQFLEHLGFRPRLGRFVCERNGYLAGNDQARCIDLNAMLADPSVRGVVFARGGYGIMRLLQSIDYDAAVHDPKPLLGMSDLTALQLAVFAKRGLVTLAGPMAAGQMAEGLDPVSAESLSAALMSPLFGRDLFQPCADTVQIERHGRTHGLLLGGCLSLVTSLLGTPFSPDYDRAVLFLEDVNEPLYRIDRMLVHLKLAGVLDRAAGLVLGHFIGPAGEDLSGDASRLVMELTAAPSLPIVSHFPHGHKLPNLTVPHGAAVELDTRGPSLVVLQAC